MYICLNVSAARREYRSRSVQPQSQRPPVSSQSGPILDSGSTHGLVQRLSNSQLSFNTSIASIFSQVHTLTSYSVFLERTKKRWVDRCLSSGPSSLRSRRDQLTAPGRAASAALQPGETHLHRLTRCNTPQCDGYWPIKILYPSNFKDLRKVFRSICKKQIKSSNNQHTGSIKKHTNALYVAYSSWSRFTENSQEDWIFFNLNKQ